jgi:hypothetical protein
VKIVCVPHFSVTKLWEHVCLCVYAQSCETLTGKVVPPLSQMALIARLCCMWRPFGTQFVGSTRVRGSGVYCVGNSNRDSILCLSDLHFCVYLLTAF